MHKINFILRQLTTSSHRALYIGDPQRLRLSVTVVIVRFSELQLFFEFFGRLFPNY
ncbi:hypothetical protein HanRHA438_Chr03g0124231 [Helianthus annuus]|nr:hypothetical protein HanIR_Chr03g0122581 [Helianthus annuus]KAJ0919669.1 hypothetical protein HanRHA438_Chr05g0232261 [Helianthus annuus]KAJ0935851.1 hypothetical protein HanRHA438_Chr03g0124231 [Helianthus annuus]